MKTKDRNRLYDWPDSIFPEIGLATAYVLFEGLGVARPRPSRSDWEADAESIERNRLAATALRVAPKGSLSKEIVARFRASSFTWAQLTAQVIAAAADPVQLLEENRIEYVITKGPGIAQFYPSLVERPFSDIDIVVSSSDFERCLSLLTSSGLRRRTSEIDPRSYFQRHCMEAVNLFGDTGSRVDIHHHIPPWVWAQELIPAKLIKNGSIVRISGLDLRIGSSLDNLVIASLHVFSDHNQPGQNLLAWRDVLFLLRLSSPDEVARKAAEYRLVGWMSWIFRSYPEEIRPIAYIEALEAKPAGHGKVWRLGLRGSKDTLSDGALLYSLRLPFGNACLYLIGNIFPTSKFVAAKFPNSKHPYMRWFSQALQNPFR